MLDEIKWLRRILRMPIRIAGVRGSGGPPLHPRQQAKAALSAPARQQSARPGAVERAVTAAPGPDNTAGNRGAPAEGRGEKTGGQGRGALPHPRQGRTRCARAAEQRSLRHDRQPPERGPVTSDSSANTGPVTLRLHRAGQDARN